MTLEDIIKLGKKESTVRGIHQDFIKESGVNAMAKIAVLEGRGNDPAVESFADLAPARQREYLEQSVGSYQQNLSEAVLMNFDGALDGFKKPDHIVRYLLNMAPTNVEHGLVESHKKAYVANALLQDEVAFREKVTKYIKETVGKIENDLKAKKISAGLGNALAFVYSSNKEIATAQIYNSVQKDLAEFGNAVKMENGREYLSARFKAMDDNGKVGEAYNIGRAITEFAGKK